MLNTSFYLPKNIRFGAGVLRELGEVSKELRVTHLFVITRWSIAQGPVKELLEDLLLKQNVKVTFFSDCKGEPTTDHLSLALSELDRCQADCVVGLGGGSQIDLAKAVSVFAINKDICFDDIAQIKNLERLPLIAVPTTAGTGSEATKVMVITDITNHIKKNPAHPSLIPDVAILDPELTVSLPKPFIAYTGLDALAHAMEAFVSTRATVMSDYFAIEATRMIGEFLSQAYIDSNNIKAREKMLLASCYAGIAFSNASTNLAHAAARPLGARFHVPHGLSVALLLPFVIEYGLESSEERYATLATALGSKRTGTRDEIAGDALDIVHRFNASWEIWTDGLKYIGTCSKLEEAIPLLVKDALSGNGIVTNRRIPSETDVENIYRKLLSKLSQYTCI